MRCKGLTAMDAEALLRRWVESPDELIDFTPAVKVFGDGEELDEAPLEQALAQLVEEVRRQKDAGKLVATDAVSRGFDAMAAEVLHRAIPADVDVIGRFEFWIWLAVTHLREVIIWRFPGRLRDGATGSREPTNPNNFGLGSGRRSRVENYPYKLWMRADCARVGDGDPYRFVRRGDVDFWTSHVMRQGYAAYRGLARALVKFQFPDELGDKPRLFAGQEKDGKQGMRTLAKLLKRLQANVEFVLLDEAEADVLIRQHATGLHLAEGGIFSA